MASDMTRTDKQRKRLISLLEELFQIDQPDLDFGFYKIMHAKADTVSNFLQKDLLEIIKDAFGESDDAKTEAVRVKYEKAIQDAKSFGAPDPEATEPVQKAKAAYDAVKDSYANEGEIYEHLYRFFERYYDNGDFMSRRYFARETDSKAAPYSIPYDGREVYLHWANQDQYYIKTSEYLTNFTFDIACYFTDEERVTYNMHDSLKLHCRIVNASEGEHNNNKTTGNSERFFLVHSDKPAIMENGELALQFEYRPDSNKPGKKQASTWQRDRIDEAEKVILQALEDISEATVYSNALRTEIGEDKNKRTLLRKYLNQYTKRNTTDYFIHKDLGSFLSRELDFYIKNEIMHLDNIESTSTPRVQAYLEKIKVLRKIGKQLITFLTQLEEFQKKLWLKKKFVTETQYCITLDRIPKQFYKEIAENEEQRKKWVELFAIDEIQGNLHTPSYSEPLTVGFLESNPFLVLDTMFFTGSFKDALIASMQNLDEDIDGLLIHSENFQALGLMQEKYKEQVKCIYIDPPYNTDTSEIAYKNGYKHSSWNSLIHDRLIYGKQLLRDNGFCAITIDYAELLNLGKISDSVFEKENQAGIVTIYINPKGRQHERFFSSSTEYMFVYAKNHKISQFNRTTIDEEKSKEFNLQDNVGKYRLDPFIRVRESTRREKKPKFYYPIYVSPDLMDISAEEIDGYIKVLPRDSGKDYSWKVIKDSFVQKLKKGMYVAEYDDGRTIKILNKFYEQQVLPNLWKNNKYYPEFYGTNLIKNILGGSVFSYPKSVYAVSDYIKLTSQPNDLVLDYFSGSGTTGHAVVNLNRGNVGKRKYIMVEMGNYFDEVTRARMQKVVYSENWKDGKPVSREGISHVFKYIRLESYEDTLNNLSFKRNVDRDKVLRTNDRFRQDYMLKYWLEFETKDSSSLFNIQQFNDPTAYTLKIKKPASDEYEEKVIDIVESFNWLIGLHVDHLDQWCSYNASFKRDIDTKLPDDDSMRLILDGQIEESEDGKWLFRKAEGRVCRVPGDMDSIDRVLVIWRKLTENLEEDNLMLDEWFKRHRTSVQGGKFDTIYVNGSNNLSNLRQDNEHWKVRLIEEAFHQKMWDVSV